MSPQKESNLLAEANFSSPGVTEGIRKHGNLPTASTIRTVLLLVIVAQGNSW